MNKVDLEDKLTSISQEVSKYDEMYNVMPSDNKTQYWKNGLETIQFLNGVTEVMGRDIANFNSILDYGSGFGRLTRYFAALYGSENVTVCYISKRAVDFSVEAFGVHGHHVKPSAIIGVVRQVFA